MEYSFVDSSISDDKVEQFHLSDAFDATCRTWEVCAVEFLSSMPMLILMTETIWRAIYPMRVSPPREYH